MNQRLPACSLRERSNREGNRCHPDCCIAYIVPFSTKDALVMGMHWLLYFAHMDTDIQVHLLTMAGLCLLHFSSLLTQCHITTGPLDHSGCQKPDGFSPKVPVLLREGEDSELERLDSFPKIAAGSSLPPQRRPQWYTKTVHHWTNYITLANSNFAS